MDKTIPKNDYLSAVRHFACDNCGEHVRKTLTRVTDKNFCDNSCRIAYLEKNKKKQIVVNLWCANCKETFPRDITYKGYPTTEHTFCSSECATIYGKEGKLYPKVNYWDEGEVTVMCKACKEPFTYDKRKRDKVRKTCSATCQIKLRRKNKG